MVKNPPTNAGDIGLIPGLGRFHMPWSNQAYVPQLNPHATTAEPTCPRACALIEKKPRLSPQLEKSLDSKEDAAETKNETKHLSSLSTRAPSFHI